MPSSRHHIKANIYDMALYMFASQTRDLHATSPLMPRCACTAFHCDRGSCCQAMSSPLTPTLAKSGQKQAIDKVNFACDSRVECENRVP